MSTKWMLRLTGIKGRDLKDTGTNSGMFKDPQDPAVHFEVAGLADSKRRTPRAEDVPIHPEYDCSFDIAIDEATYTSGKMLMVKAMNEGATTMLKNKLIGQGEVSLLAAIPSLNTTHTVTVPLNDNAGRIIFTATISAPPSVVAAPSPAAVAAAAPVAASAPTPAAAAAPTTAVAAATSAVPWKLRLESLRGISLFNTGSGSDLQDPALKVYLGGKLVGATKRLQDAGVNANWPEVFRDLDVREADYNGALEIKVEVYNEHMTGLSKQAIGEGKVLLRQAIPEAGLHQSVKITIQLALAGNAAAGPRGTVEMMGYIDAPNKPKPPSAYIPPVVVSQAQAAIAAVYAEAEPVASQSVGGGGQSRKLAEPFKSGRLIIKDVICSELKANKARSVLQVELANSSETRESSLVERNASMLRFDNLDFKLDVELLHITGGIMTVKLKEERTGLASLASGGSSKPVPVGRCQVALDFLLTSVGEAINLSGDILDDNRGRLGRMDITAVLLSASAAPRNSALSAGFIEGVLCVDFAQASDLRHAGAVMSSTVNNPLLNLAFEGRQQRTEKVEQTIKGIAKFKFLEFEAPVTATMLASSSIDVEILDQPLVGSATSVGKCSIPIKDILVDELTEFTATLVKGKDSVGQVTLKAMVMNKAPQAAAGGRSSSFAGFTTGTCRIKTITAKNLKNTELTAMFGTKQDPFVMLSYGQGWTSSTVVQPDAGSNAIWQDVNFIFPVTAHDLTAANTRLVVKVFDKNSALAGDKLIGIDSCSLLEAAQSPGSDFKLKLQLKAKEGSKENTGEVIIVCSIKASPTPEEAKMMVPSGFEGGVLRVKKISALNLTGGTSGKALGEPVVSLSIAGKDTALLKTGAGVGSTHVWPILDWRLEVSAEEITNREVTITVADKDKLVSTGKLSNLLRAVDGQIGKECEVDVDLFDSATNQQPRGSLTMYMAVRELDAKVLLTDVASDFSEGELLISSIRAKGLAPASKPSIQVQIGARLETMESTPVAGAKLVGDSVRWDDLDLRLPMDGRALPQSFVEVALFDHGSLVSAPAVVGRGKVCLDFFKMASRMGVEVELTVETVDKQGRSTGRVILGCLARKSSPEQLKATKVLPAGFDKGIVKITKIRTVNLTNTEGFLGGKQDPFIVIKDVGKTHTLSDKGGSVIFEHLDLRTNDLTAPDLQTKLLTVQAWDENNFPSPNVLIGEGTTSVAGLFSAYGEEVELPVVKLVSTTGGGGGGGGFIPAGRVYLYAVLEPAQKETALVPFPPGFTKGLVLIRSIAGFKLKNTNWTPGSKADPYVRLSVANESALLWEGKTAPQMGSGDHAVWDLLDLRFEADAATLTGGALRVECWDKNNATKDVLIGTGIDPVSLRGLCTTAMGTVVELSVDLVGPDKKPAGKLLISAQLQLPEAPPDLTPKDNFSQGKFVVSRIRTFDLKNVEFGASLGNQMDPYLALKFGSSWSDRTHTKEGSGGDVLWDYLNLGAEGGFIPADAFREQSLQVSAFDENTPPLNDVLIGTGDVSLALCTTAANMGKEVRLPVTLKGPDGKPAGRLDIFVTVMEPEPEPEVGEITFDMGYLEVKRVTLTNLKSTCRSPMLELALGGGARGNIGESTGEEANWRMLDWRAVCTKSAVLESNLVVTITSTNLAGLRSAFGTANILFLRAAAPTKIGQEVELKGTLESPATDKPVGEVSVVVKLVAQQQQDTAAAMMTVAVPEALQEAALYVSSVRLGLPPALMLRPLFARIEYGSWNECTATANGGFWSGLAMETGEVERSDLLSNRMRVVVLEENSSSSMGSKEIASGTASFKSMGKLMDSSSSSAAAALKQPQSLKIELKTTGGSSEDCGTADVAVFVGEARGDSKAERNFADNASFNVTFKEIWAYDLTGGDTAGLPDPYVKLSFDKWNAQSEVKEEGGRTTKWLGLGLQLGPLSSALVAASNKLKVVVKDKNNIAKDAKLGMGTASLVTLGNSPGQDVKIVVKLKDGAGRSAGRIEVVACATLVVVVSTEPAANKAIAASELSVAKTQASPEQQPKAVPAVSQTDQQQQEQQEQQQKALMNEIEKLSKSHDDRLARLAEHFEGVKSRQEALNDKVGGIEKSIQGSIQSQLDVERSKILDLMNAQTRELGKSIESISKNFSDRHLPPQGDQGAAIPSSTDEKQDRDRDRGAKQRLISALTVSEISSVKLPPNIADWRTAHVQAWLAFQVELPDYMERFQKASIDGFVLIKHVDDELLGGTLGVLDDLHRKKILEHIELIRLRQEAVDRELAKKRKAELQRAEQEERERQEEEDRREEQARLKREKELLKAEKKAAKDKEKVKEEEEGEDGKVDEAGVKRQKKKKVKRSSTTGAAFAPPVGQPTPEQNQIDRVRLERAVKVLNADKKKKQSLEDDKNRTWKFEYTGSGKPPSAAGADIWGPTDTGKKKAGSKGYLSAMAALTGDVLQSTEFQAGVYRKIKSVKKSSVFDEVLAEIKGAMFALSSRLLEVRRRELLHADSRDADLDEEEVANADDVVGADLGFGKEESAADDDDGMHQLPGYSQHEAPEGIQDAEPWEAPPPPIDDDDDSYWGGAPAGAMHEATSPARRERAAVEAESIDRMQLVFEAIVGQTNNDAFSSTSSNNKLTRLKFLGALESLLLLKMDWAQFDALWFRLDSQRSGDLDLREFKAFFGDLSEFEQIEGAQNLSSSSGNAGVRALTKCLYELCDIVRHAGFTVEELFSSFDRNGSGTISVAEFTSLLRLIVGNTFDKKLIHQALFVLDTDRSKSVSREEIFLFVYKTWRSQMQELDLKMQRLDEEDDVEAARITELLKERKSIVAAIKKNFPRQLRDQLQGLGTKLQGPFASLFASMSESLPRGTSEKNLDHPPTPLGDVIPLSSPKRSNGANEVLRFKIKVIAGQSPTRQGMPPSIPPIMDLLSKTELNDSTQNVLRR